jgi:RsiW-degrading membrane proteinase PrsW (M82 family)
MKKIFLLIFLGSLIFPSSSLAAGLVPCGGSGEPACQLCHLFVLLDNILDFVFKFIVLPVATLLIVIGGGMFFFYAENPQKAEQAKTLLTSVVIGLVIIFAAFLIVGIFLNVIGLANWTKDVYQNWWEQGFFTIPCSI